MTSDQGSADSLAVPMGRMRLRSMGQVELQNHKEAAKNVTTASSSQYSDQQASNNHCNPLKPTTTFVHLPSLKSLGLVDKTSRISLSLHDRYVRSFNNGRSYNVNASYLSVKTLIQSKRVELIRSLSTLLGPESEKWFGPENTPRMLPSHPLDWSTVLLKEMHLLAASMPDTLSIEERLVKVSQSLRTMSCDSHKDSAPYRHVLNAGLEAENQKLRDEIEALQGELRMIREELHSQRVRLDSALQDERRICALKIDDLEVENACLERKIALLEMPAHQRKLHVAW